MIFKYPYTDMYALNLDWIIQAIKEMQETIGPLDRIVNSVNGMTGDVEITKALLTQILGNLVETFNGRTGDVELTAEDVNNTLIDITWASDPGDTIGDLSQSELDEMYLSGKRVLIFVNNLGVADQVYFLQYYEGHAQPQEYSPTAALAGVASFNGQTGNVTATGADLATSGTDPHTIAESLAYLDEIKVPTVRTVNNKPLSTNISINAADVPSQAITGKTTVEEVLNYQSQQIDNAQATAAYVEGDTASRTYTEGQFVYIKNHSTLAEGLYRTTTAIPATYALSTSNLTAVESGGLNALNSEITKKTIPLTAMSGVTLSNEKCFEMNGVVYLSFYVRGDSLIGKTIVSIPSDYAPSIVVPAFGISNSDDSFRAVYIGTTGNISAYGADTTDIRITIMYIR